MDATTRASHPRVGDIVEIYGHEVGASTRRGEILEVLGQAGQQRLRVRWEHGRESILSPSSDAVVRPGRNVRRETP